MPNTTEYGIILDLIQKIKSNHDLNKYKIPEDENLHKISIAIIELGEMLEKRNLELKKLLSVTQKITSGMEFEEIMNFLYDNFRDLVPYNRIGVALLNDNHTGIISKWNKSDSKDIFINTGYKQVLSGSSLEKVLQTQQPRIISNLEEYFEEHPQSESTELILKEGVKSSLTCPLIISVKPVGFIFFSSFEKNTYSEKHSSLFQEIAAHISIIIEKSRLYTELIEQKKHLEELNNLKNKFLGIAAHDLKNPLSIIEGYCYILLESKTDLPPEERTNILTDMQLSAKEMRELIEDLLDISKIESGTLIIDKRNIDVMPFIYSIVEKNRYLSRTKNITIHLEIPDDSFFANFDPGKITQVINNLITNAVKFSQPGMNVYVALSKSENEFIIEVKDEGPGIKEGDIHKLFEGFYTGEAKPTAGEKSTGLGLAICKKVVEAHEGKIEVKSKIGEGSSFSVIIPI